MDLENIILIEVCQRKINIIWYHLYVESKKNDVWAYLQNRNRLTDLDNEFMVASGEGLGAGIDGEFQIDMYIHTAIFKIDNQ